MTHSTDILQIRQEAPLIPAESYALIGSEVKAFTRCENIIEKGVKTFIEVGKALLEIKDGRYYRDNYETFQDYCKERWGFDRQRAFQLINASKSAENVKHVLQNESTPINARQAAELAKLPDEVQAGAWKEVIERTDGKPTAAAVQEVVEERTEAPKIIVKQNATITKKSVAVKREIDDGMTIIRALVKYGLTRKQYKQAYFISQFGNDELIRVVDKGILTLWTAYVTAKICPDKLYDVIEAAKLKAESKNHSPVTIKGRSNQDLIRELLVRTYYDWAAYDKNIPVI